MQINVKIEDAQAKELLREIMARTGNLRPVMQTVGEIVRTSVERNFAASGRPAWLPSGRVKREGGQTLSKTGRLRRSFSLPEAITAGDDYVAVGTDVIYAAIHQFGGKTPPRTIVPLQKKALFWPGAKHPVKSVQHPGSKIPARPFLMVQAEDWTEIRHAINDYLLAIRR